MLLRKSASLVRSPIYHTHTCTSRTRDRNDKRRLLDPQAYTHRTRESQHGPNRVVGAHHCVPQRRVTRQYGTARHDESFSSVVVGVRITSEPRFPHQPIGILSFDCAYVAQLFSRSEIFALLSCALRLAALHKNRSETHLCEYVTRVISDRVLLLAADKKCHKRVVCRNCTL